MNQNRLRLILGPLLFALFVSGSGRAEDLWLVKGGKQAGPIVPTTTLQDLLRFYGKANVKEEECGIGEGESEPCTKIYEGGKPIAELHGERNQRFPILYLRLLSPKWYTAQDVHVGSSLEELTRLNGKPFTFIGLEVDNTGEIVSWQKGKLTDEHIGGVLDGDFYPKGLKREPTYNGLVRTPELEAFQAKAVGYKEISSDLFKPGEVNVHLAELRLNFGAGPSRKP